MSLILDALKKSENDRKNASTPSISDVRSAPEATGTPRWLWVLLGLLLLNLLVLMFVLTRGDSETAPQASESTPIQITAPASAPRQSNVQLPPVAAKEPVRSLAREATSSPSTPARTPSRSQPAKPASSEPTPSYTPAPRPSAPARNLPSLNSLRADSTMNIPELQLDLHVYNEEPAQRLVFINGSKYLEGANLAEGPQILTIRPDGVAMRHRGIDFLLPRE